MKFDKIVDNILEELTQPGSVPSPNAPGAVPQQTGKYAALDKITGDDLYKLLPAAARQANVPNFTEVEADAILSGLITAMQSQPAQATPQQTQQTQQSVAPSTVPPTT
jgi:hypothetical protein